MLLSAQKKIIRVKFFHECVKNCTILSTAKSETVNSSLLAMQCIKITFCGLFFNEMLIVHFDATSLKIFFSAVKCQ